MLKLLEVKRRDASAIRRCFGCIWRRLFKPMERNDIIKGDLHKKCSKVCDSFDLKLYSSHRKYKWMIEGTWYK